MINETDPVLKRVNEVNFEELKLAVGGETVKTESRNGIVEKLLVADKQGIFQWGLIREVHGNEQVVYFQDSITRTEITGNDLQISKDKIQIVEPTH